MPTQAVESLFRLLLPKGSRIGMFSGSTTLAQKRQHLAEQFVKAEHFGAMLCLDSDMTLPPDTVLRLLQHNVPVVAALMFARQPPYLAEAEVELPDGNTIGTLTAFNQGLQRVLWAGTGCLLIRREALLKVPPPWFEGRPGDGGAGEDMFFCERCAEVDVPVYVDTDLAIGHLGITSVDLDFARTWGETHASRSRNGSKFTDGSTYVVQGSSGQTPPGAQAEEPQ